MVNKFRLKSLLSVSKDRGYGFINGREMMIGIESKRLAKLLKKTKSKEEYLFAPLTKEEIDYLICLI